MGGTVSGEEVLRRARSNTHIIIFHVSIGRSASLKDQSNFSSATGSSVGSWYGDRYSCARPPAAVIRFFGSKTSIFSSRSMATGSASASAPGIAVRVEKMPGVSPSGSAFVKRFLSGCRSRLGNDCTNLNVYRGRKRPRRRRKTGVGDSARTFSLQMVWSTSSGGLPKSSVMMENWLT